MFVGLIVYLFLVSRVHDYNFFFLLQETGVGKTVNSFRKHEVAGELAKGLVAQWKKLVPQSAERCFFVFFIVSH